MAVQNPVEKKMTIETKLLAGFLAVYIISAAVPGLVIYLIDTSVADGLISDAMIGLITFCIILIIISLLAAKLMKWITKPVRKLSKAAEQLVAGNLEVDLEVEGSQELQTISNSLERMKSSLRIATDWLGPPEIERYKDDKQIMGVGLNEKIIIGMVLFLIFNPLATSLSHMFFSQNPFISSMISIMFSIIILSLISNYLYTEIIKPLDHLANMAEKVSKGHYSAQEERGLQGDMGRLERNILLISQRIQRAMKELDMNG